MKMIHEYTKIANTMHLTRENLKHQKGVTCLVHPECVSHMTELG